MKKRTLTGYRPTGKLHLGHWFGNLQNMLFLQHEYDAYYFVADYHALTTNWEHSENIRLFTEEMVLDWVAAGLDPDLCTIYKQSDIPQVIELMLMFAMVLPMSWLERTPSYKEQREQITDKDLSNVGFFLYPALQAADITIVRADCVPVGEDQAPHLELTREIVRRFSATYGPYLIEPKSIIPADGARVPGSDGRKMSKSYGNSIYISDSPEAITATVSGFMTDPARKLKTDPGDPDICPLHQIHKLIADPNEISEWEGCCRTAQCGCVAHKNVVAEELCDYLAPFQARRAQLSAQKGFAEEVLEAGRNKVWPLAEETISTCRRMVGL